MTTFVLIKRPLFYLAAAVFCFAILQIKPTNQLPDSTAKPVIELPLWWDFSTAEVQWKGSAINGVKLFSQGLDLPGNITDLSKLRNESKSIKIPIDKSKGDKIKTIIFRLAKQDEYGIYPSEWRHIVSLLDKEGNSILSLQYNNNRHQYNLIGNNTNIQWLDQSSTLVNWVALSIDEANYKIQLRINNHQYDARDWKQASFGNIRSLLVGNLKQGPDQMIGMKATLSNLMMFSDGLSNATIDEITAQAEGDYKLVKRTRSIFKLIGLISLLTAMVLLFRQLLLVFPSEQRTIKKEGFLQGNLFGTLYTSFLIIILFIFSGLFIAVCLFHNELFKSQFSVFKSYDKFPDELKVSVLGAYPTFIQDDLLGRSYFYENTLPHNRVLGSNGLHSGCEEFSTLQFNQFAFDPRRQYWSIFFEYRPDLVFPVPTKRCLFKLSDPSSNIEIISLWHDTSNNAFILSSNHDGLQLEAPALLTFTTPNRLYISHDKHKKAWNVWINGRRIQTWEISETKYDFSALSGENANTKGWFRNILVFGENIKRNQIKVLTSNANAAMSKIDAVRDLNFLKAAFLSFLLIFILLAFHLLSQGINISMHFKSLIAISVSFGGVALILGVL